MRVIGPEGEVERKTKFLSVREQVNAGREADDEEERKTTLVK